MVPWLLVKQAGRFTYSVGDHTGGFHPPSNHGLGSAGRAAKPHVSFLRTAIPRPPVAMTPGGTYSRGLGSDTRECQERAIYE